MTNQRIGAVFERIATLLEEQAASPFRVRAWREAARSICEHDRELAYVFRDHGRVGLEAIPQIGPRLSAVIIELLKRGTCGALERLEGEHRVAGVPAHPAPVHKPPIELLLDIDRAYVTAAQAGRLHKIAPHRFNPERTAWLPIMHGERDGWSYTAMFSNTELAHRLGRTDDWVVIYLHEDHGPETQATVVTEQRGRLRGHRVVRGRERECVGADAGEPEAARQAG